MKEYKLESLIYYTELFTDKEHILRTSTADIQAKLTDYGNQGWRSVSTKDAGIVGHLAPKYH